MYTKAALNVLIALIVVPVLLLGGISSVSGQAGVDGRNVVSVEFGQPGQILGAFRQTGPRSWVELDAAGTIKFRFEETQRDDWSVYLVDRSRNVHLQLDLHTRKVMYSDANSPRQPLYDVVSAAARGTAAGLTPLEQQCHASVQGRVAWNQQGDTQWNETNVRSLCRGTTNPSATIDCFRAEINAHGAWSKGIASCAGASGTVAAPPAQIVNGRNVTVVEMSQSGRRLGEFRRVGPRQWAEIDANGAVTFRFEETQRDEWSVYLVDRSRNVHLQLDLHTRKVMYSDASSPRRVLYDINAAYAGSGR